MNNMLYISPVLGMRANLILASSSSDTAAISNRISLFRNLSTACLALAIFFAAVSVLLFFYFRIPDVYNFLTGRAQKRSIRQMQEDNAKSGRLREDRYHKVKGDDGSQPTGGRKHTVITPGEGSEPTAERNRHGRQQRRTAETRTAPPPEPPRGTVQQRPQPDPGADYTQRMPRPQTPPSSVQRQTNDLSDLTTVLNEGTGDTTLLNEDTGGMQETMILQPAETETELLRPADSATQPLQPADAATEALAPTDAVTEPLQPADAETELLRPADAATEALTPADAVTEVSAAAQAVTEPLKPADSATVPLQTADAATEPLTPAYGASDYAQPAGRTQSENPAAAQAGVRRSALRDAEEEPDTDEILAANAFPQEEPAVQPRVRVRDRYGQTIPPGGEIGATVVLTPELAASMAGGYPAAPQRKFVIVKEQMEIHTDERID